MKAIWKGALNFGLVTIDLELFTAIEDHAVKFKLLHDVCETPIHNLHWCDHCNKAVEWEHIVKGLPLSKNKFVVLTKEKLKSLKALKSDVIHLETFVDKENVEPILFDTHYYALPHKEHDRAYGLFVAALEKASKVAVGKIIFKEREHVCILQPYHDRLLLSTLHFGYEIRPLPAVKTVMKFDSQELELAQYLIDKLSHKKIKMENFKDTFVEKLKRVLSARGKKALLPKTESVPRKHPPKIALADLLKKSVMQSKSVKKASSRK